VPLFQRFGVEDQLAGMYQPLVQLKSGGYLVINPTEALVSIDINSGRSTREHNIEQTAYATNIEAANEIARQLRLRDMAGLVVIDFIDMESNGHIRKVERAMKEALKNDRARIQVGRISSFGLMEMSRQRLRTGVLEASTRPCPHCDGSGLMRTASSAGLSALRMLEDEAARGRGSRIILRAGREAAVYVLNRKRNEIGEIEARYGVIVEVLIDDSFEGAKMTVEALGPPPLQRPRFDPIIEPEVDEVDDLVDEDEDEEEEEEREEPSEEAEQVGEQPRRERGGREESEGERDRNRKRRRRRGRRGGKRREGEAREGGEHEHEHERHAAEGDLQLAEEGGEPDEAIEQVAAPVAEEAPTEAGQEQPRRARRRPRARRGDAPAEVTPVEAVEAAAEVAPEAEIAAEIAPSLWRRRQLHRRRLPSQWRGSAQAQAQPTPQGGCGSCRRHGSTASGRQ
jgi:ribonuclease E